MRRTALALASVAACLFFGEAAKAQDPASAPSLEGTSPAEKIYTWGTSLLPSFPEVVREITAFPGDERGLSEAVAREYSRNIRAALFGAARDAMAEMGRQGCEPFIRVSFPDPEEWGFADGGSDDEDFLKSLIRTEAVACYGFPADPVRALDLYTSPEFRMEAESRIARMWQEDGLSCVDTKGVPVLLSPTEVCNRVDRLVEPGFASEHSQVVRNGAGRDLQKVFFKESLKTYVSTPEGLAFHYINYTRSVDLGRASRWVAPGKIEESQRSQMELLRNRIGG